MKYKKWTIALGQLGLISQASAISAEAHDNRARMSGLEKRVDEMEKQLTQLGLPPTLPTQQP